MSNVLQEVDDVHHNISVLGQTLSMTTRLKEKNDRNKTEIPLTFKKVLE
jgi:hypothetical protein